MFMSCPADIAIFGGAAGGGKSFALLLEPLRHYNNPKFGGVIFRRNSVQVRNEGGLWDESMALYSQFRGYPRESSLEWEFPSGARMKFAHLEFDRSVFDWQGSQIPYLGFDELVHFSERQFFYMLSRNRSMSGVPGYVRATCNPDADSWVRRLIDWWIDKDGYPIAERQGIVRYFIRQDDLIVWGESAEELTSQFGSEQMPKSFTFIHSSIRDNKILMEKDPSYLSNLMALSRVERMRLLGGNWNVRATAGQVFQREWFEILDVRPADLNKVSCVRYWDRAATKPSEENKDPDWTSGLKLSKTNMGVWIVEDVRRTRDTPMKVEQFIKNTALQDGYSIPVCIEQDPGSSGVADAENYVRMLAGFNVRVRKVTKDKVTRALPVSAQCEAGNVKIIRGNWNEEFFSELENFGEDCTGHDDQVDCLSGAFNELSQSLGILDVL